MNDFQEKVGFIWSVAELLRGDFEQSEYGKIVLPLTVLRRLDCVLEKSKSDVLEKAKSVPSKADDQMKDIMLYRAAGQSFYNLSPFVLQPIGNIEKSMTHQSLIADQSQFTALRGMVSLGLNVSVDSSMIKGEKNRYTPLTSIFPNRGLTYNS